MTNKRKEYPQAEISRQMLASALLKLMDRKPYQAISVAELAEEADLSRRTFYRHFNTIQQVLDYQLDHTADDFVIYFLENSRECDVSSVITHFFSYWGKHRHFLEILQKNGILFVLLETIMPKIHIRLHTQDTRLQQMTESEKMHLLSSHTELEHLEYILCFVTGGAFNLLVKWLEQETTLSPSEMADICIETMNHFLVDLE